MKSFFNYSRNRILYSLLRLALFIAIGFLIGSFKVKADIVQYKFIDYVSTSSTMKQTNFSANETYTYTRDYVLFNGNDKFFAFNYCATGPFDFSFPNDFEGVTQLVGYATGGRCYVQGYEGYNYTMYFMAKEINDAGNGNLSIMFNTQVHNRAGYFVYINVLSLTSVDSIPAGVQIPTYDGEFSTINTKIDTVEQAVQEVKKAQNEQSNEQKKTNDKLDTAENTRKGIWDTIKSIPGTIGTFFENLGTKIGNFFKDLLDGILEGLKKLFIPEDMSFIDNLKESLENKLGFIASVPLQVIDYILALPNKIFTPITSITFPEIPIFGVKFWSGQEIDISEGLKIFQAMKYFGDIACVIIVVNTLNKWYRSFGGGN